jgi:hypothetical protein
MIEGADGTYSLAEIASIVRIPEPTLFRWRWQGRLLTAHDFLVDADVAFRIASATLLNDELRGAMPPARFDLEDIVRLRIVGFLGDLGWDRQRLLSALAGPYALPVETGGDGHTARDPVSLPEALVLGAQNETALGREAFETLGEAHAAAGRLALAVVINLDVFRREMRAQLAAVDLDRERRAARRHEVAKAARAAQLEREVSA